MSEVAVRDGVPNLYHFVWFGRALPLFAELAMRAVVRRAPGAEVCLWHESSLAGSAPIARLTRAGVESRLLDFVSLLDASQLAPALQRGLLDVWGRLRTSSARSNLVRLLVLHTHGGVYLDTDTLLLRDLARLRSDGPFCGLEHALWPHAKLRSQGVYRWVTGPWLTVLRAGCALLPHGERLHARWLHWYSLAANNAVLGFTAGHPFLGALLGRAAGLAASESLRRYRLGTHLLQETLADLATPGREDVRQHPPRVFYPLGPIISKHYFRPTANAEDSVRGWLSEETMLIHWYASTSDLAAWNEPNIRLQAGKCVFAHLCAPLLDPAP